MSQGDLLCDMIIIKIWENGGKNIQGLLLLPSGMFPKHCSPLKPYFALLTTDSRILSQRKPKNYQEEEMDMRLNNTNTHYSILG